MSRQRCSCGASLVNQNEDPQATRQQWFRSHWQNLRQRLSRPHERMILVYAGLFGFGSQVLDLDQMAMGFILSRSPPPGARTIGLIAGVVGGLLVAILQVGYLRGMALSLGFLLVFQATFRVFDFTPFSWLLAIMAGLVIAHMAEQHRSVH